MANVGALLRPSRTAPARTILSTAGLLNLAMRFSYSLLPSVVANPAWSMFILTVTGTPARGPGSFPRANRLSTRSACSRTRFGRQSTIAVIRGLTESSRCSAASATSRADTLRVLTRRATSLAERRHSSIFSFLSAVCAAARFDISANDRAAPEAAVIKVRRPILVLSVICDLLQVQGRDPYRQRDHAT